MSQETKASNWCEKHGQATRCTECNPLPKPKLRITLYLPDGSPLCYWNCTLGSSLVPELEFRGYRRSDGTGPEAHIISTTLPYVIEVDEGVVDEVIDIPF